MIKLEFIPDILIDIRVENKFIKIVHKPNTFEGQLRCSRNIADRLIVSLSEADH